MDMRHGRSVMHGNQRTRVTSIMFSIAITLLDAAGARKALPRMRTSALPRIGDEIELPSEQGGGVLQVERVRHFAEVARSMDFRTMTGTGVVSVYGRTVAEPL